MKGITRWRLAAVALAGALLASCAGLQYRYTSERAAAALAAEPKPALPSARFAVLSDPHLFDRGLGTDGPAFAEYLANDRKLLVESEELLDTAIGMVRDSGAQFLLVPGDLTKDGERQDHELFARTMGRLVQDGIKVFVVPGNHDIENPDAMSFDAAGKKRVPWVTPEEFSQIYGGLGYKDAIARDPASLSYLAEPVPGLWLLAIASCDYANNAKKGIPETDGRLSQATVRWIEDVLADALGKGKAVIAMMHHGVMEHYIGQQKYFGEYIIDDYQSISAMLASYGVRVVFTGHYHAQDVTLKRWEGGAFLYDVETGSLVSAPDAVRFVEVDTAQTMHVRSRFITSLPSFEAEGRDFAKYSESFSHSGISGLAVKAMKGLGVPDRDAQVLAPQIADAFLAHYKGDEKFTGTEMLKSSGLSFMGGIVMSSRRDLVTGLWKDLEPADNNLDIDLSSGAWRAAGEE